MKKETKNVLWKIATIIFSVLGWIVKPLIQQDINRLQTILSMIIEAIPYIFFIVGIGTFFYILIKERLNKQKEKIIALKTFRDKEMIRIVNHFNAQLKIFEDRISALDKIKPEKESPNEMKNSIENKKSQDAEIKEYNNIFKDWKLSEYAMGENTSIYKTQNYGI